MGLVIHITAYMGLCLVIGYLMSLNIILYIFSQTFSLTFLVSLEMSCVCVHIGTELGSNNLFDFFYT